MKRTFTMLLLLVTTATMGQIDLSYYLPEGVSYDPDIPKPSEIIGHEVGEWHITHDRLVSYMQAVAAASPRIEIEQTGLTHEGRPQLLLIITSVDNHASLDDIKQAHKQLTQPDVSANLIIEDMPAVVWQGFSIHGNEPSGSNASMLTAYHYAAAQGEEIDNLLSNLVILLDPSFNPDGLTRFSTWANSRKSRNLVVDPNNMEQNEYWPGGRTNHYWFDLNRDWLTAQQPESQNRIAKFHEWKPNVLTDHHEMGTNSTFFFQPGIPSRNNPNTPSNNFRLTEEIGKFHAKALDRIGSLYYSKESYDDFFYGKGSTFPDINGAVGILFEQASSRGHAQESDHGILKFPFTIRNQFVTSLSTTEAAVALRVELLEHQRKFFQDAVSAARSSGNAGIVFGSSNDASRARELANVMLRHEIELYEIGAASRISNLTYHPGKSYYVPLDQPQYKLIDIMFETTKTFQDSLFYDVSTWTLPLAFNLDYDYVGSKSAASIQKGDRFEGEDVTVETLAKSDYAYAFEWDDYYAPKLLWTLLANDILCKVANEPFSTADRKFDRGSIMIPVGVQQVNSNELHSLLVSLTAGVPLEVLPISSGTTEGVNLGSRTLETVEKPEIAVLVEGGIRSYDAGEVWHLLDNRFGMAATMMPVRIFNRSDLDRYNTIVLVNGNYGSISGSAVDKLKDWVSAGGNLIAFKSANNWLKQQEIISIDHVDPYRKKGGTSTYADMGNALGAQATGGSIFRGRLDITHPLAYGYSTESLHIFVNSNSFFVTPDNPYSHPFVFSDSPLASGYVSEENLDRIKNTSGIIISRRGRGRILSFSFNPNFRAFWYGTNKLFLNAIFFADMIDGRSAE